MSYANAFASPFFRYLKKYLGFILIVWLALCAQSAYAVCKSTDPTTGAYTYTAATLTTDAVITFSGSFKCYNGTLAETLQQASTSANICMSATFSGNSQPNNGSTLPYTVSASVGSIAETPLTSGVWYGVGSSNPNNNAVSYTVKISIPAQTTLRPANTYSINDVKLFFDMQGISGSCDRNGGWDQYSPTFTATFSLPKACFLQSISNIDFGSISDIGQASKNYDSAGAITSKCTNGTPYSIYLGDGNNRISGGNRRMRNGSNYLPYQLYKSSAYSAIWDATGGTVAVGGSGGIALTGTGINQTTAVFGRIAASTVLPNIAGNYTDDVIVTITY